MILLRVTKAENEELKERLDILYKLSRSYVSRLEALEASETTKEVRFNERPNRREGIEEKEVIKVEADVNAKKAEENAVDNQNPWTQNKLRGFKRINQTSGTAEAEVQIVDKQDRDNDQSNRSESLKRSSYCHFFSNYGYCRYEEKNGKKCRFEHKADAPLCQNGNSCNRHKCMFRHPKSAAGAHPNFLGPNPNWAYNILPWQIMSPWLGNNPGQYQYSQNQWMNNQNQSYQHSQRR